MEGVVAGERDRAPPPDAFCAREGEATAVVGEVEGGERAVDASNREEETTAAEGEASEKKELGELPGTVGVVASCAKGTDSGEDDRPVTPNEAAAGAIRSSASVSLPSSKCKNRLKSRANLF
jgi:hypothetical protein